MTTALTKNQIKIRFRHSLEWFQSDFRNSLKNHKVIQKHFGNIIASAEQGNAEAMWQTNVVYNKLVDYGLELCAEPYQFDTEAFLELAVKQNHFKATACLAALMAERIDKKHPETFKKAKKLYTQAIFLCVDDKVMAGLMVDLGSIFEEQGDFTEAHSWYSKSMEKCPTNRAKKYLASCPPRSQVL